MEEEIIEGRHRLMQRKNRGYRYRDERERERKREIERK